MAKRTSNRRESNKGKSSITAYLDLSPVIYGPMSYLSFVENTQHRFILIRFRLNYIPFMLGYPANLYSITHLPLCPCDGKSTQTTLDSCSLYVQEQKRFIVPLLRKFYLRHHLLALLFIHQLETPYVCYVLASFLWAAVKNQEASQLGLK